MCALSLWKTRRLLKQLRRDVSLQSSRLQQMHLVYYWDAGSCGDTATVRSGEENHVLDGDRPMANRRDLLESELQDLIREAWEDGQGYSLYGNTFLYDRESRKRISTKLHELLISYFDSSSGDVGAQDETLKTGTMGDCVRPKRNLIGKDKNVVIVDEADLYKRIRDEFVIDLTQAFEKYGKVPMVRYEEKKKPDGSIAIRYIFAPFDDQQNPR